MSLGGWLTSGGNVGELFRLPTGNSDCDMIFFKELILSNDNE